MYPPSNRRACPHVSRRYPESTTCSRALIRVIVIVMESDSYANASESKKDALQRQRDQDRARRAAETPDHYVYAIAKKKKALISMLRHSYRYQRVFSR